MRIIAGISRPDPHLSRDDNLSIGSRPQYLNRRLASASQTAWQTSLIMRLTGTRRRDLTMRGFTWQHLSILHEEWDRIHGASVDMLTSLHWRGAAVTRGQ